MIHTTRVVSNDKYLRKYLSRYNTFSKQIHPTLASVWRSVAILIAI